MLAVHERTRSSLAAAVLRGLLFLVLLGGGLMGEQYRMAQEGSLTRLYEDLRDHDVDAVEYSYVVDGDDFYLAVRWSTGLFSWRKHQESGSTKPVPKQILEAFPEDYAGPQGQDFENDLRGAAAGQKVDIRTFDRDEDDHTFWARDLPDKGLPAVIAALALFAVMLTTRDHRYANRWAWFWMFLLSPLGMLGYLWLEKRPFPPPRPPRAAAPIGGFVGLCYAVVLGILFVITTFFATWLLT